MHRTPQNMKVQHMIFIEHNSKQQEGYGFTYLLKYKYNILILTPRAAPPCSTILLRTGHVFLILVM